MELCHSNLNNIPVTTVALVWFLGFAPLDVIQAESRRLPLSLVDRVVTQDQGSWIIDYRLRNATPSGIIITPEEVGLKVKGWVSNSRVTSHAVPRWLSLTITPCVSPTAFYKVINAVDESQRCRERLAIQVWEEDRGRSDSEVSGTSLDSLPIALAPATSSGVISISPLSLSPGDTMHLQLRIDHEHILYGDYDPLLGVRIIDLVIGDSCIRDVLPFDREQYIAQPKYTWPNPPEERRDTRHFVSAPDSLHLEADVHGHQSYRYQECPVRYNTKMKLRFWYLIASGTEGECRLHIGQNKDTPLAWRQLHEASFKEHLTTIGRWMKYERIIQTHPEATRLILEYKIMGEFGAGEMWIDDLSLEPSCNIEPGGP